MYACVCVCLNISACMHGRMYEFVYACTYVVFMYVCMDACVYEYL